MNKQSLGTLFILEMHGRKDRTHRSMDYQEAFACLTFASHHKLLQHRRDSSPGVYKKQPVGRFSGYRKGQGLISTNPEKGSTLIWVKEVDFET